ncbi:MAG: 2Fe-2S iron-sulfur cluster binding domain-containing protein [Gammaproteobacteria bacterium]|nr:2Fe-2S iron-sulfur cluster binding domain-containing protein [Gammaproteobacteria bacterium]
MARNFAEITFTESVRATQTRYGSRDANRRFEEGDDPHRTLTAREKEFIEARDGFYQATVGQNGWPYVQFRGGPEGFVKVLDGATLGYADFRGNVQYISVGNLHSDARISLILMDYPNRRRLKVWARASVVDEADDPALIARLEMPNYRARVERAIVLKVEAYDWNCPQHITPKFTEEELRENGRIPHEEQLTASRRGRPALESGACGDRADRVPGRVLGAGPLELYVAGIRQLTSDVRAYELRAADGRALPDWSPGAHLSIPVREDAGRVENRPYSLAGDPARTDHYLIAVRRHREGRGGSDAVHRDFALGLRLRCSQPRNDFTLHDDRRPALLIAGGIGITPLRAMALAAKRAGRDFVLHAIAPSRSELPFRDELVAELGAAVRCWSSREAGQDRPSVNALLDDLDPETVIYVCGPARLLEAVLAAARARNIDAGRIRFERFAPPVSIADEQPITVELRRSGRTLAVRADQSILEAAIEAGIDAPYDCRVGTCGRCAVQLLAGGADHRDTVLTREDRVRAGLFCPCVSRARGGHLALDL